MSVTTDPRRFGGVGRLFGEEGARRLAGAHVAVVGLGGVGSWVVEALVRTSVGRITLIDGDDVALSNTNRQLPAFEGAYGRAKAEVLRERCLLIFKKKKENCPMRITELFTAQSIALDVAAPDQAAILDKLVDLQATHGNITDKDAYKKALYAREAEASTYVDNGITVPHARTACVTRPSLAALRLSTPVQYNADDDGKTDLLFAIAAPENGSLHIDMLARMMQMLMNDDFVEKLRAAKTPAEFLDAIDAQEDAQFGEESFTQQEIPRNGYRVLAVTACPNGIAHTYMAAEALTKMGDKLGLPTKVETNGSDGAKNVLTPDLLTKP